jgi:PAS domain S-box-containing protein
MEQVVRRTDVISAWASAPRAILGWMRDGTLVFATSDHAQAGLAQGGIDWQNGLASSYQEQFAGCPELIAAIGRAYEGQPGSETVRLNQTYWDVRLWPMLESGALKGVVGILADASDRITAHRTVQTIEVLAAIRYRLARSDSPNEFLANCCRAIEQFHTGVWIGVAERDDERTLQVVTGASDEAHWFSGLDLSWDVARKNGRHPPGQAVRTGRVQTDRDVGAFVEGDAWISPALPWTGLLAIPLQSSGHSIGVLVIHGGERDAYDPEMARLWEQVASEITEGLELLRSKEERARIALERQGAYLQYQQLLNTIFHIVVIHREGRVIEINPAGVKLFAATSADQLVGTPVLTLIAPADRERMSGSLAESPGVDDLREFRLLSLDGRSIDVEGLTVSVMHGGAPARLSHWRDISERKRAEQLILQQKISLEYAQQVSQSGSIDFDIASGRGKWSRNALVILGLAPEMQEAAVLDAIQSVVVAEDQAELARFIETICLQGKEHYCEVNLQKEEGAAPRCIHLHGIPQVTEPARPARIFMVVQDISRHRNTERQLKAKLAATWRLARVSEWTYELAEKVIVFHGDQKDFLGFESPIRSITYDQFIASIRKEDRDEVQRAVTRTLRHGSDGEAVYEERFHEGVKLLLYSRWVPERGEDGKMIRFRGLALDISRVRDVRERQARAERLHETGLPEREMAYDRLFYLSARSVRLAMPFSVVGLRVANYREIKRLMANDALYLKTQNEIVRAIFETVSHVDTFARLGRGCFALILSAPASPGDEERVAALVGRRWQDALREADPSLGDMIGVTSTTVHCPQDSAEWEALLELLEQRILPADHADTARDQPRGPAK